MRQKVHLFLLITGLALVSATWCSAQIELQGGFVSARLSTTISNSFNGYMGGISPVQNYNQSDYVMFDPLFSYEIYSTVTSSQSQNLESQLSIYPNPLIGDELYLKNSTGRIAEIRLIGLDGSIITIISSEINGSHVIYLPSSIDTGTYIIEVTFELEFAPQFYKLIKI